MHAPSSTTESGSMSNVSVTISTGWSPAMRYTKSLSAVPTSEPIHISAMPITNQRPIRRGVRLRCVIGGAGMIRHTRNASGSAMI